MVPSSGPLESGSTFAGGYRIERPLSHGGMGHVYVATQLVTGRQRALKVMRADLVKDPKLRQRFEQEAKVGARIQSDHVVEVVDAGVDAATEMPWLAMELLDGESLGERVARGGALGMKEAQVTLDHVAHALIAAHRVGVVHRDLKPENVFVANPHRSGESKVVKVLDFGIAKVIADARPTATSPIGTLQWMAPEQTETDGAIGPATDIWSFGLLGFFVLTGRPFWGEDASPATMVKRLIVEPIPRASERAGRELPRGFDAWFARCVARDPAARFTSIDEANRELGGILDASEMSLAVTEVHVSRPAAAIADTAPAVTAARPSASRTRWIAGALIAAAVVVAVVALRPSSPGVTTTKASPPMASAAPSAAPGFTFGPDDHDDHDTVWRVPLGDSPRRGGKEPLVTIAEFGDFECPFTRASEDAVKEILSTYGDDVAVVWKDSIPSYHPVAEPAARLARFARAEQGDAGFWRAHDLLFSVCSGNDVKALYAAASDLGLPAARARAAIDGPSPEPIERDNLLAADVNALFVPCFYFNGRRVSGSRGFAKFRLMIDAEIAKAKALVAAGTPRAQLYDVLQRGAKASQPETPVHVDLTDLNVPVRIGAHAVVDVHQFGSETDLFDGLRQPVIDWLLQEYGDRIRFHWHWAPDSSNATATHVADFSRKIFFQNGSDVFWRFHRLAIDNAPWEYDGQPVVTPMRHPRGVSDEALVQYVEQAGGNALYARSQEGNPDAGWSSVETDLAAISAASGEAQHHFLLADGFLFGVNRFEAKRVIESLIAEHSKR